MLQFTGIKKERNYLRVLKMSQRRENK